MKSPRSCAVQSPSGRLRLLETTDLHMQLLDYDYFADRQDPTTGLMRLADQIAALRDDPLVTTILCDNGDLIQGNPLADFLAQNLEPDQTHPMIAALNMLRYDAMTLGNHEFDYGPAFLRTVLSKATFPVVCANVPAFHGNDLVKPFAILERNVLCDDGSRYPIKVGIIGFAPPQFAGCSGDKSKPAFNATDIRMAAEEIVPQVKDAGADVIVALCHSGIGLADNIAHMENAALPLAQVAGIDALLLGHTHEAFPDASIVTNGPADFAGGRLHGKPAVMAEFGAQSFGVIEMDLRREPHGWQVTDHQVRLEKASLRNGPESKLCQDLRALVTAPHIATVAQMQETVVHTTVPITSYFATIQPDLSQQLLAQAMQRAVSAALEGSRAPVLAATSSYRFGGRSGLGHYIDIPIGPITLRDVAAIFPFADHLCAVRRTGKQLRLWLERAAAHYNRMQPGQSDQPLINPQSAGYNCDAIFGLSYQIDLTQPARYDTQGREINPNATRIVQLRFQDKTVEDRDVFIVATNSFRAKSGGGFPKIAPDDIVYTSRQTLRDILIKDLKAAGSVTAKLHSNWAFAPIPNTAATLVSAPQARDHITGPITYIRQEADGRAAYRINF
ncbi:2',3'-cyclic-nucleotide 2'-phosphodiesterase/3'-nucleotidase [Loktanella sp. PT4BL]|uniref:bifunctional 2',3'-cyclic-nucleotide 2'-phosphodiesterase/3'-nucleotidase n=1 Tax=Loktanella sp. PT4BL TaxID=2135611 RepID=UPI000D75206B|nr:bifunctional 2',3'-cyclic-nucleotide 2'-phosphodiesterase/3'-nucleotidase [Loktanella sp. PT4BL]PXW68882.1 2',3'-cyclic-nucleotide 2'-phosphodiesterase/3'-nucleotidase [Loktanella sp. PT4BL]